MIGSINGNVGRLVFVPDPSAAVDYAERRRYGFLGGYLRVAYNAMRLATAPSRAQTGGPAVLIPGPI